MTSDADETAEFKGFYGKYDIELALDGRKETREISFYKKSPKSFEIVI